MPLILIVADNTVKFKLNFENIFSVQNFLTRVFLL